MGWCVQNILPMTQFLDATMVGRLGTNFGIRHDFLPVDIEFGLKKAIVPKLEQGCV